MHEFSFKGKDIYIPNHKAKKQFDIITEYCHENFV